MHGLMEHPPRALNILIYNVLFMSVLAVTIHPKENDERFNHFSKHCDP